MLNAVTFFVETVAASSKTRQGLVNFLRRQKLEKTWLILEAMNRPYTPEN